MARYAAQTIVGRDRSLEEVHRLLERWTGDAVGFGYGVQDQTAAVEFVVRGRRVRFLIPLPDRSDDEFTRTPTGRPRRNSAAVERLYEQAIRQRYRALVLVIKAKLEAVESGIVEFEEEFGMHFVLPDGRRVSDHVLPAVERAYLGGKVSTRLLPKFASKAGVIEGEYSEEG